jgi:hypothetical protein
VALDEHIAQQDATEKLAHEHIEARLEGGKSGSGSVKHSRQRTRSKGAKLPRRIFCAYSRAGGSR